VDKKQIRVHISFEIKFERKVNQFSNKNTIFAQITKPLCAMLPALYIEETQRTPNINLDYEQGLLEISGYRSMPEVSTKFYEPVMDWVEQYVILSDRRDTLISIKLEYFNTSSGKCLVDLLKKLDKFASNGHQVKLQWYYEQDDEDMSRSGDDMAASVKHIRVEKIPYQV